MCRIGSIYFSGYCEGLVIKFCFFSLLSSIFGFHEKRTAHISFLAFQTNFLKQDHCDNNKTDACTSFDYRPFTRKVTSDVNGEFPTINLLLHWLGN